MATRKTKREKTTKLMVATPPRGRGDTMQDTVRDPSAAMISPDDTLDVSKSLTREVAAVDFQALIDKSARTASVPHVLAATPVAPPAPPTTRMLPEEDPSDLAQTIEGPAITSPRLPILDAGEALIAQKGFPAVTDEQLATAAGVPIDIFHAHFANKKALLRALNQRFCDESIALTNEATKSGIWDRATPRDVIEVAVRSILDVVLSKAALVRAVLSSGDEGMLDAFRQVGANITAQVGRVLSESEGAADADKPNPRDVAFAFLLAVGLAHHAIMVGTEWSGLEFDREELYERTAHAAAAYLESRS